MKEPVFLFISGPLSGFGHWHMSGRSVYRDWPRTSSPVVHQVIQQVDGQGEHDCRVLLSRNVSLKKRKLFLRFLILTWRFDSDFRLIALGLDSWQRPNIFTTRAAAWSSYAYHCCCWTWGDVCLVSLILLHFCCCFSNFLSSLIFPMCVIIFTGWSFTILAF